MTDTFLFKDNVLFYIFKLSYSTDYYIIIMFLESISLDYYILTLLYP